VVTVSSNKTPNSNDGISSFAKNNAVNRFLKRNSILEKQVMDQNKALNNIGKLKDFKVLEATGEAKQHLAETGRNPEYFPKGDTWFPYKDDVNDKVPLSDKNKFRTLINDDSISKEKVMQIAGLDFASHALHNDPQYIGYSKQLEDKLLSKYPKSFIDNNGGVDGYMRGLLSDDPEYAPYKKEMSFIDPEFIKTVKEYVTNGSKKAKKK